MQWGYKFTELQKQIECLEAKANSLAEAYAEAERLLKGNMDILTRVAEALLLVETIDGEQFESLFTGEYTAEGLYEKVKAEDEEKKARDQEEAAETERLRKEEEEKLAQFDTDYLADAEAEPEAENSEPVVEHEAEPKEENVDNTELDEKVEKDESDC